MIREGLPFYYSDLQNVLLLFKTPNLWYTISTPPHKFNPAAYGTYQRNFANALSVLASSSSIISTFF